VRYSTDWMSSVGIRVVENFVGGRQSHAAEEGLLCAVLLTACAAQTARSAVKPTRISLGPASRFHLLRSRSSPDT
jgi:hypothetical protein